MHDFTLWVLGSLAGLVLMAVVIIVAWFLADGD